MSQADLTVYISIIELSFFTFIFFYGFFILTFSYPYFKNIIFTNRLFVKNLNNIFFVFFCIRQLNSFVTTFSLNKY